MNASSRLITRTAFLLALIVLTASVALAQPPPPPVWHAPTLTWAGGAGYVSDGLNPDIAKPGYQFVFKVKYKHQDNMPARSVQVVVRGPNGQPIAGSPFAMTSDGTTAWILGVVFSKSVKLTVRGTYSYRFAAGDGLKQANLPATGFRSGPVVDSAPALSYAGVTGYLADGVEPNNGPAGTTFIFRVKYTQADNAAPTLLVVHVWGPDGKEITGSPFSLQTGVTSPNYAAGVVFGRGVILRTVGLYSYQFEASDGLRPATFPATKLAGPRIGAGS